MIFSKIIVIPELAESNTSGVGKEASSGIFKVAKKIPAFALLAGMALLCLTLLFSPAFAEPLRSVSVSAHGEIKAAPDKVDVSLGLNEMAPELETARKAVDDQLKALYAIRDKMGIAEKDLETMYSSVHPEYRYNRHANGSRERVLKGYHVRHQVRVTLRDIEKLADFTDAVLKANIDEIHNTQYGLQEQDALKEKALTEAMHKAKRKAGVLAEAADATLGKALTISEGSQVIHPHPPMTRGVAMMEMASADGGGSTAPPAGEIEVRATVSVMYALED